MRTIKAIVALLGFLAAARMAHAAPDARAASAARAVIATLSFLACAYLAHGGVW